MFWQSWLGLVPSILDARAALVANYSNCRILETCWVSSISCHHYLKTVWQKSDGLSFAVWSDKEETRLQRRFTLQAFEQRLVGLWRTPTRLFGRVERSETTDHTSLTPTTNQHNNPALNEYNHHNQLTSSLPPSTELKTDTVWIQLHVPSN